MINIIEHHIQRDIFSQLCLCETIRFTDLKPKNLESNIFMYHLKRLIKLGYVVKNSQGEYQLSPQGLAYADKLSFSTKRLALQPKIVIYLHITDKAGAQLYWRRKVQPSINKIGTPLGKLHYGEDIAAAATRELFEKTGLKGIKLQFKGLANLRFMAERVLVSNILCLVFSGVASTKEPALISGKRGEVFWSKEVPKKDMLPSVTLLNDAIKNAQGVSFFVEKSFNLK
jgi:ADP-ribose pyrophosphatase YjhB (NUDIX family)